MVSLTFNEIDYQFKFNYNTHKLHILKNGKNVSSLDYNPIIVHQLSLTRCVQILLENNLIK
jgi:hypothetical protein